MVKSPNLGRSRIRLPWLRIRSESFSRPDIRIQPAVLETRTNIACAGDVNGDGKDDFIAGAQDATGTYMTSGVAYGWYGSSTGLNSNPSWIVPGLSPNFYLGFNTKGIGDVDGDGFDDVIVSAMSNYHAYVYRGSASGLATSFTRNYYQADPSSGFGTGWLD